MHRVQMLDACATREQRRKGEQEKGEWWLGKASGRRQKMHSISPGGEEGEGLSLKGAG